MVAFVLLYLGLLTFLPKGSPSLTAEEELVQHLLNNTKYSTKVRPVLKYNESLKIQHALEITQLIKLDEKNQVITTSALLRVKWKDDYLIWNPQQFHGILGININVKLIWFPKIELFNSAEDDLDNMAIPSAYVKHDGSVDAVMPLILKSTCPIKVRDFPYDSQICELSFGSFQYDVKQVFISPLNNEVTLSSFQTHAEWDLKHSSVSSLGVRHGYSDHKEFSGVSYRIQLDRKPLYYVYNFIMPCLLIAAITTLLFLIPPQTGERMAVGVTILLSLAVFFLLLENKMPETSDSVPLIGKYFACTIAEISIAVGTSCLVLVLHHHEPVEVPRWMKKYILGYMARMLRIRTSRKHKVSVQSTSHSYNEYDEEDAKAMEEALAKKYVQIWRSKVAAIKEERLKRREQERLMQSKDTMSSKQTLSNSPETMVTEVDESDEEKEYWDEIENKYLPSAEENADGDTASETANTTIEGMDPDGITQETTEESSAEQTKGRPESKSMTNSPETKEREKDISKSASLRSVSNTRRHTGRQENRELQAAKLAGSQLISSRRNLRDRHRDQHLIALEERQEQNLKILADNVQKEVENKAIQNEWRMVAKVINYFCMWLFIFATILTFLICFGPFMVSRENGIW